MRRPSPNTHNTMVTTNSYRWASCRLITHPDNVCEVPYRRALEENGIISHANRALDNRHATIDATQYYGPPDSLAHCRPPPVTERLVTSRHTRQGLRRFKRELSCLVIRRLARAEHRIYGVGQERMSLPASPTRCTYIYTAT